MTRVPLTGGAYSAHSVIASAQRQVNLYSEPMPEHQTEPQPAALYPTPGTRTLVTLPKSPIRGGRFASNGKLYVVAGDTIYSVNSAWSYSSVGSITPGLHTPVSLMDNSLDLVIVDGTANGWKITLASDAFAQISDPTGSFRGGDRVDYLDTYLLFNVPGTPQFQASDSLAVTFDPLWFANKSAAPDSLVTLCVAKREIWLLGAKSTEVFYDTGAPDFPFQSQPSVFIPHGCAAKYSVATVDNAVYWLSRTNEGQGIVVQGSGYQVKRISTYAIEAELAEYTRITDAIGMTYQIAGHMYYVLAFPHANKTWCFDATTGLWCELVWLDANGSEWRHRMNCAFAAYGQIVVGDWQNGNLYALDPAVGTDAGGLPIKRQRRYPHMVADGKRVFHQAFTADMETGTGGNALPIPPRVSLSWSDDRGHSFGSPVTQSIGASGEYRTSLKWNRLGMCRDRVYDLTWSTPYRTALQGCWVDTHSAGS